MLGSEAPPKPSSHLGSPRGGTRWSSLDEAGRSPCWTLEFGGLQKSWIPKELAGWYRGFPTDNQKRPKLNVGHTRLSNASPLQYSNKAEKKKRLSPVPSPHGVSKSRNGTSLVGLFKRKPTERQHRQTAVMICSHLMVICVLQWLVGTGSQVCAVHA